MMFSRRSAVQFALALWAKAEDQVHQHGVSTVSSTTYEPKFLKTGEIETIKRFAEIMIPPSGRSQGAAASPVANYMDHTLANAAPSLQRTWRTGLKQWSKAKSPDTTLARLAANEFAPKSKEDQFFILFKSALTAAFYTSEEGILKELGYQGMAFLREFPGYQGEAFTTPSDYKPLLRTRS